MFVKEMSARIDTSTKQIDQHCTNLENHLNEITKRLDSIDRRLGSLEKNQAETKPAVRHAIHHRLNHHPAPWTFGQHPDDYKGPVWIRITPATGNANQPHTIRTLWGQYLFEREPYIPDGPLSLTHHKTNLGSIPLQINVEPAATVTVGQGPPPDEEWINIDEGWTRLAGVPIYR